MTDLTDVSVWETGIYRLETTDLVIGGAGGTANVQPQQLANRTRHLKDRLDGLYDEVRSISDSAVAPTVAVPSSGVVSYVVVPSELNEWQLVRVSATLVTGRSGGSGNLSIMPRRVAQSLPTVDLLDAPLSIPPGETKDISFDIVAGREEMTTDQGIIAVVSVFWTGGTGGLGLVMQYTWGRPV